MSDLCFGEIIRAARQARDLSQAALAAKLGCSQAAVAQFEACEKPVGEATMTKVAVALGITVPELLREGLRKAGL